MKHLRMHCHYFTMRERFQYCSVRKSAVKKTKKSSARQPMDLIVIAHGYNILAYVSESVTLASRLCLDLLIPCKHEYICNK